MQQKGLRVKDGWLGVSCPNGAKLIPKDYCLRGLTLYEI
jgi:hypothetical protein